MRIKRSLWNHRSHNQSYYDEQQRHLVLGKSSNKRPLWPSAPFLIHLVDLPSTLCTYRAEHLGIFAFFSVSALKIQVINYIFWELEHIAPHIFKASAIVPADLCRQTFCVFQNSGIQRNHLTSKTDSTYFTKLTLNSWFVSISEVLDFIPCKRSQQQGKLNSQL